MIDPTTAIRNAAKARASSDEELTELLSLFGETWAKASAEYVPGPASLETLAFARMEQDYANYLRDRGRHPAGMTGVADAAVEVVSLDDDVGEDEDGEAMTRHEITPYPPNATPRGYADPSIEAELVPALAYVHGTRPAKHMSRDELAVRYNGPTPKELQATRDARRAWRSEAFKRGAGTRQRDARLAPVVARRLNIEAHTDPVTGGMDRTGWPDYVPKVAARGR